LQGKFSFLQSVQNLALELNHPHPYCKTGVLLGAERPELDADRSPPFSEENLYSLASYIRTMTNLHCLAAHLPILPSTRVVSM
jgi:hypothetical protein